MASITNTPPSPAAQLAGLTINGGWKVLSRIPAAPNATGGQFSVGYHVENIDGRKAFLKALDYSRALKSPDPARALQAMILV